MTNRPVQRALGATAIALAAIGLTSCATTYDTTLASAQASTSTSSTLPSGTLAELLPRLVAEAANISPLLASGGDADGALQREQELWDAVKTEVNAERPDMLSDFSSMIDLSATAVRFDRAADADKAAKNLKVLTDVFLDG